MTTIIISAASRALLEAAVRPGARMLPARRELPDGRFEIEVDEDVHAALLLVDPDPDAAIRVMFTTGVGHA